MSETKEKQGFVKEINKLAKKKKNVKTIQKRFKKWGKNLKRVSNQVNTIIKKRSKATSKMLAKKVKVTKIENKKVIAAALTISKEVAHFTIAKTVWINQKATPLKNYLTQKFRLVEMYQMLSGKLQSQFILRICKGDENKKEQILQILAS